MDEVKKTHEDMLNRMEQMQVSKKTVIDNLNNNTDFFFIDDHNNTDEEGGEDEVG